MSDTSIGEGEIVRFPSQGELDETIINPEILPAVRSLRSSGIETTASNSGIDQIDLEHGWGSYIQIIASHEEIVDSIVRFADATSEQLRRDLGNPELALQLVSAERWFEDRQTTSRESNVPIFRLQLVGHVSNYEIRYVWDEIAARFALTRD